MDFKKVLEMVRHTVELGSSVCTYDRIKPILVLQSSKASFHKMFVIDLEIAKTFHDLR